MKVYLSLTLIIFLLSCKSSTSDKKETNNTIQKLTKWHVVGPFDAYNEDNFLDTDNLSLFGYSETSISYNNFISIKQEDYSIGTALNDNFISMEYNSPSVIIDFNQLFAYDFLNTISGNVYAGCTISSEKSQLLRLNFTSDDGAKIWLNNEF